MMSGKSIRKKSDKISNQIVADKTVSDFQKYLEVENDDTQFIVDKINLALAELENEDKDLAGTISRTFKSKFSNIDKKYHFRQINTNV